MSIDCTNLTVTRHPKLKENTQKTKSKRVTRTPPKTGSMDQVHRQVSVILYLAKNAQEFIFVHIPKKNMGDNPLRQNWPYHFFLGATPMGNTSYLTTSTLNTTYIWAVLIKLHDSATYDDRRKSYELLKHQTLKCNLSL
jgi:hypothetical protein